jgi:Tfp pilus assembly protein PilF
MNAPRVPIQPDRTRAVMLVTAVLVAFAAGPPESRAQTPPPGTRPGTSGRSSNIQRGRMFTLNVKDKDGTPVPNAIAFIGEVTTENSDTGGVIRIEQRPPVRLPMMIDVQAPGYRPRQILIDGFERGNIDVYLEKVETATGPRGERSISVGELSPERKEAAQRLEDAGIKALAAGENERAEGLLRAALEQTPSSSLAYTNLGISLVRQGRFDEAVPFLEKGFTLAPYSPVTAGNLGLLRWVQGRRDECYELLDRAIALGFTSPLAHYNLGVLALGRGYHRQAAEELQSVDSKRFRYRDLYLSIAFRGLRQPKLSAKAFQEFLQRNPVSMLQVVWHFAPVTGE